MAYPAPPIPAQYPPPAPQYPPPSWGETQPRKHVGRRIALVVAALLLGLVVVLGALVLVGQSDKPKAKDALRQGTAIVNSSFADARRAEADFDRAVAARGRGKAKAIRELQSVVRIRTRAIREFSKISALDLIGDKNYKRVATLWIGSLRDANRNTTDAIRFLRGLGKGDFTFLTAEATATMAFTHRAFMQRYDKLLRSNARKLTSPLL